MSKNYSTQLLSPSGLYNASYTTLGFNTGFGTGMGVLQVDLTGATSIEIQGRMSPDAPGVLLKKFTTSSIEQLTFPYFIRAVSLGGGKVWVGGAR